MCPTQTACCTHRCGWRLIPIECAGDFTGNGSNFQAATEEDISIVCGSCTATTAPDVNASPASKFRVGVVAVGAAGMGVSASAFAVWC